MRIDRLAPIRRAVVLALLTAAICLPAQSRGGDHWAFRRLVRPPVPRVTHPETAQTAVDAFVLASLEKKGLSLAPATDRATLLRRVSFDLVGLPPRPEEIERFVADRRADAYARAVERLLASPHYGERWGKYWLDVAGYADSNGYFNADSDRPLAFRYRDYVIRALNRDQPFDEFVREQLAGDELSGHVAGAGASVTPRVVELFTATHFLRNSQDGTSESDGNADELRIDRATVLQGTLQITMNALLGITIQCARCHDHKFEPVTQADYYGLQSVFYPAFPAYDADRWIKPKLRVTSMASGDELAAWEAHGKQLDRKQAEAEQSFRSWVDEHRPPGALVFRDDFNAPLKDRWTGGEGTHSVSIDSSAAPGAAVSKGSLAIVESGQPGDRWLKTRQAFNWTPERDGDWIEASFDLVADHVEKSRPAERIAYFIALNSGAPETTVGGLLVDGNPAGGAAIHANYGGSNAKTVGEIGSAGYRTGRRYGIRVTNAGGGKFRLQHVVDMIPETKAVEVTRAELPRGAFGFEYCCGRSFVVDNVTVETSGSTQVTASKAGGDAEGWYRRARSRRERELGRSLNAIESERQLKPGSLAAVTDVVPNAPPLRILKRGNYADLGKAAPPSALAVLCDGKPDLKSAALAKGAASSGRRLALAQWLTSPPSRASALMARVTVNRIWQRHFGKGLVTTPDNFGLSGVAPSHPELLEYLAQEFRSSGWSIKSLHRLILMSAVYQQSSAARPEALAADPEDRLLWRFPLQRLDAEAVRDSMLAVSGELSSAMYGFYVPTVRQDDGNVVVRDDQPGAHRRGIYLQQRRTQIETFLELFDAPVMVNNCAVRGVSTVPLQSLALLNSQFIRARAETSAGRFTGRPRAAEAAERLRPLILAVFGRAPTAAERDACLKFLAQQSAQYGAGPKAERRAWSDLCQMLLASDGFLYVE